MERPERERARLVDVAFDGQATANSLLDFFDKEEIPMWKATLLDLASRAEPSSPRVLETADQFKAHENASLQRVAVQILSSAGVPGAISQQLMDESPRNVRLVHYRNIAAELEEGSPQLEELMAYLDFNSDQPTGALQRASVLFQRGRVVDAESWIRKAIRWDEYSPPLYEHLALVLNARGKPEEALDALQQAADLAPDEAGFPFMQALIHGELGNQQDVIRKLNRAVAIDPQFHRAHYNLGLALAAQEKLQESMEALQKAIETAPEETAADYYFALATVQQRAGKPIAATASANAALRINPQHPGANAFLRQQRR
jgi:tetratricopeptide (TPR) repeat protein